jgi:asparagine synthetase B (glutamine-hydrolysing)
MSEKNPQPYIRESLNHFVGLTGDDTNPKAVFLSGGIDSAIILYHVTRYFPEVSAYTLCFDGMEGDQTEQAAKIAAHFGVAHRVLHIGDMRKTIFDANEHTTVPRYNVWPLILMQAASADGYTDFFIGEGSDEIFGYHDRSFLTGWAGQIKSVRAVYDELADGMVMTVRAPFTDFAKMFEESTPTQYLCEDKCILRDTYADILPAWMLATTSLPPRMVLYKDFVGKYLNVYHTSDENARRELMCLACNAWLHHHEFV